MNQLTKGQQNNKLEDKVRELAESIDKADIFKRWDKSINYNNLANYSLKNMFLIMLQKRGCVFVRGYNQFKKMGFQVQKGEKAMMIVAPQPHKRYKEEDLKTVNYIKTLKRKSPGEYYKKIKEMAWPKLQSDDKQYMEELEKTDKSKWTRIIEEMALPTPLKEIVKYVEAYVFDITQTVPLTDQAKKYKEELLEAYEQGGPEIPEELNREALIEAVQQMGYKVKYASESIKLGGSAHIDLDTQEKVITLNGNLEERNYQTVMHELAHHELGHTKDLDDYKRNRGQREFEAEATGYFLCVKYGIKPVGSETYIKGWYDQMTKEELIKELMTISTKAEGIYRKLDKEYRKLADFTPIYRIEDHEYTKEALEKLLTHAPEENLLDKILSSPDKVKIMNVRLSSQETVAERIYKKLAITKENILEKTRGGIEFDEKNS